MTEANRGGQPHVFSHDRIVEKIFLWAILMEDFFVAIPMFVNKYEK